MSKTRHENWKRIGIGLLRHLRGKQSQAAFSRSLGFSFNKVSRWESEAQRFTWDDLAQVCRRRGFCLYEILDHLFSAPDPFSKDVTSVLKFILDHNDMQSLLKRTKFSRFKLERWLRGTSQPDFSDVMTLILEFTGYHWDVIVEVYAATAHRGLHPEAEALCPALRRVHEVLQRRELIAAYPEAVMADLFFENPAYKSLASHEDGFVAKRLGISILRERKLIKAMLAANMLGKSKGKYHGVQMDENIRTKTRQFGQHADIITHWLNQAARVLKEQRELGFRPEISSMSYRCFMVSDKTYLEILERVQKFYLEIGSMIRTDSETPTLPRVMAMQVFDPAVRVQLHDKK